LKCVGVFLYSGINFPCWE